VKILLDIDRILTPDEIELPETGPEKPQTLK
jgi:hypothetical protein